MTDLVLQLLSGADILALSDPPAMVAAMERALAAMAAREVTVPPRAHLEQGETTLLVMPSAGAALFGAKLVTVAPRNAESGLPATQGLMLLFDAATGMPVALLDAASLTGQRTGAVSAVAIKRLSPPALDNLGVIGCGVQGTWAAIHAAAVRPIRTVFCLPRSPASYERFRAALSTAAPHVEIRRCETAAQLLEATRCVVAATTSAVPVLPDAPDLLRGKLLVSIGSFRPHMQELPDAAFGLSGAIVVDSPQAIEEVGDVIHPLARGLCAPGAVIPLHRLLAGEVSLPQGETRVFKSVGHAAYDLFAAEHLLGAATSKGIGGKVAI